MTSSPRVTVVTPVYNLVRYLPETVASVDAQTYPHWEHVIVDDGSTSAEAAALLGTYERAGRTVIRTENRGIGAARNTGFSAGSGEYLLALDSDDRLAPTFLERTVAALDAAPGAGLAAPGFTMFGAVRGRRLAPEFDLVALLCGNVVGAFAVIRRRCWEEAGGYPERSDTLDLDGIDDWSLFLSIIGRGWTWVTVPEYLFEYRVRRDSKSASNREPDVRRDLVRTLARFHEPLYRDHVVEVFAAMDTKVRQLESSGPSARVRRLLRRL